MSRLLTEKLSQLRRKQTLISCGVGLCNVVAIAVVAVAVEMLADWGVNWPWADGAGFNRPIRVVLLLGLIAGLGWAAYKQILRPLLDRGDDDDTALAVECVEPYLGGRLISTIQLSRPRGIVPGTSPTLVKALIAETERMSLALDFAALAPTKPLARRSSAAGIVLLMGLLLFIFCLPGSATLLGRVFLSNEPVPRQTRVEVTTGNIRVARGESLTITAIAHGIHPAAGWLDIHSPGSDYTFSIDKNSAGDYSRKIDNVTAPFDYRVRLNDGHSDSYRVDVVDRPEALAIDCVQIFPPYIGQPDAHHLPGDLEMVAGSRLVVTVKANKPLKSTTPAELPFNRVHLSGSERDFPLSAISPPAAGSAAGATGNAAADTAITTDAEGQRGIPLPPGTTGLSVYLVDQNGLETKDPTVYHIELVPDKPPKVRVTNGDWQEELITRSASQHIEYLAADDYGLGRLSLRYTVNDGPAQDIPIPLTGHPLSASGQIDLPISSIQIPPPQAPEDRPVIRYWIYAEDLNTISTPDGQPGHGQSDKYSLRVVTDEEKRAELMTKFGAITADQLNTITTEQEQDSTSLGQTVIHGTEEPATQPATEP